MIKWLKKRKAEREHRLYCEGFGWAMAAHHVDKVAPEGIENMISMGQHFDPGNKFDYGARHALSIIKNNAAS